MQICVRKFPERKKPCLVLEQNNQSIVLAVFRNEEMLRLYYEALGGRAKLEILGEYRSIDDMIKEVKTDADSD